MYKDYHWHNGFPRSTLTLTCDCLSLVETFVLRRPCTVVRTSQTVLGSVVKGESRGNTVGGVYKTTVSSHHRYLAQALLHWAQKPNSIEAYLLIKAQPNSSWLRVHCRNLSHSELSGNRILASNFHEKWMRPSHWKVQKVPFCQCGFFFFPSRLHTGWETVSSSKLSEQTKNPKIHSCLHDVRGGWCSWGICSHVLQRPLTSVWQVIHNVEPRKIRCLQDLGLWTYQNSILLEASSGLDLHLQEIKKKR